MDLHDLDEIQYETIPNSHIFSNEDSDNSILDLANIDINDDSDNEDSDSNDINEIELMREMFGKSDKKSNIQNIVTNSHHILNPLIDDISTETWQVNRARQQALYRARFLNNFGTNLSDMSLHHKNESVYTNEGFECHNFGTNSRITSYCSVKPKGLFNFGNTCFLNVILQVLLSLDNFQLFINSDLSRQLMLEHQSKMTEDKTEIINKMNNSVTYQLRSLFAQLLDTNNKMSIRPTDLRKRLGLVNEMFSDDAQQDVAEALCIILDAVHNEHSQDVSNDTEEEDELKIACKTFWAKDYSPVVDLFYSMCQEKKSCNQCSHTIISYCPYAYIHLDIPLIPKNYDVNYEDHLVIKAKNMSVQLTKKEITKMAGHLSIKTKKKIDLLDRNRREKTQQFGIDECIVNYFKPNIIEDAVCGECQAKGYKDKIKINIVPKIFTMQIKRFDGIDKKFNPIELKENIQLVINGTRHEYKINAVINHSGLNIQSGHYYMYGKNRTYNGLTKDMWFQFNDGCVTMSNFKDITLSDVYMIFYELDCLEQEI